MVVVVLIPVVVLVVRPVLIPVVVLVVVVVLIALVVIVVVVVLIAVVVLVVRSTNSSSGNSGTSTTINSSY